MHILGISAFGDDSSAALLRDGDALWAAEEARFTRREHAVGFPEQAVRYCLESAGVRAAEVEFIGLCEKPLLHFERQIETHLACVPAGFSSFRRSLPVDLAGRLGRARALDRALGLSKRRYVFAERHESLAAAAFFPSPFEEAAVLTLDSAGEWATMTLGTGRGNRIEVRHEVGFPHSVGLLYSAFASYLGFADPSGDVRVMALAAHGEPRFVEPILAQLISWKPDGSLWMDMSFFQHARGLAGTTRRFHELFGGAPRRPEEPITQRHMDLAASIQRATEEIVLRVVRHLHESTRLPHLAVAGGIATNSAVIGRIEREGPFERVWVQPAPGGAGGALGVALLIQHQLLGRDRTASSHDRDASPLLGPGYSMDAVENVLRAAGATYEVLPDAERDRRVADLLASGQVVAWCQGRMEYGPRALGARSLLGDPRRADMQSRLNLKVKFRAAFHSAAACVLEARAPEWFDVRAGFQSPFGLSTATVRADRRAPAGSRGDLSAALAALQGTVRIQTVDAARQPGLEGVLRAFERATGCPVLLNTSFHLEGEPIVCSPEDAWRTFLSSAIDTLVFENALVTKATQRATLERRHVEPETGRERDPALESLMRCPACGGVFALDGERATCAGCRAVRVKEEGIWRLFQPSEPFDGDITQIVKGFYEEHPFPNYDENESLGSLTSKARRGIYARLLGEQLPFNAHVLEVGCGTGQLSNYLGIGCRTVVGADLCGNSLKLAEGFRSRHGLDRVRFVQMNLFRPAFEPESFDVVLCNGVLLTTTDPHGGFASIARLVKPGGHIVIGLYNTYGRLAVDSRRVFFRMTGGRMKWVDPHLRGTRMSPEKVDAWFHDQYLHPHETKQTMGEVLGWFDAAGFDFVSSVPNTSPWVPFTEREQLFTPTSRGSAFERGLVQAKMIVTGNREGGFFIMIGRRRLST